MFDFTTSPRPYRFGTASALVVLPALAIWYIVPKVTTGEPVWYIISAIIALFAVGFTLIFLMIHWKKQSGTTHSTPASRAARRTRRIRYRHWLSRLQTLALRSAKPLGILIFLAVIGSVLWWLTAQYGSHLDWWMLGPAGLLAFIVITRLLRRRPLAVGFIGSYIITITCAVLFAQLFAAPLAILINWASSGDPAYNWLVLMMWAVFTSIVSLALFLHPATRGQAREEGQSKRMLPVPPNFAVILTWGGGRIKWIYLVEGAGVVPWWFLVGVSNSPVSKTKIEIHDAQGRSVGVDERDHFRPLEAFGYVFIGRRTIQEKYLVQTRDTIEIGGETDHIISVNNPIAWQGADNPYGTTIGRLEASHRIVIADQKSRDVNVVRTLIPSLLAGSPMMFIRCRRDYGRFMRGDLIRNDADGVIFYKGEPHEVITDETIQSFVDDANALASQECRPKLTGPNRFFTTEMVEIVTVYEEWERILHSYGAIDEGASQRDITLPPELVAAAQRVEIERMEQQAEVIQAQTTALEAAELANTVADDVGYRAAQLALAKSKGTVVLGMGNNPVAQFAAAMQANQNQGNNP